jgi:geranylgeranyl transferase type-2 subunit alpha
MHGVKKTVKSEAEKTLQAQKAATYLQLVQLVLAKHRARDYSADSLALTAKMIRANPDFYTLWNFRRDILIHLYGDNSANTEQSLGLSNDFQGKQVPIRDACCLLCCCCTI